MAIDHWVKIQILKYDCIEFCDFIGLRLIKSLQNQIAALVHNEARTISHACRKEVKVQQLHDFRVLAIEFALSLSSTKYPKFLAFCNESL